MNHLLNIFPLANQNQLSLRYRLVEITGLPKGKHYHRNLQKVREHVNRTFGTPAVLVRRGGRQYVAVATEMAKAPLPEEFEVSVFQGIAARLQQHSQAAETLSLNHLQEDEVDIAASFLEFALRSPFRTNPTLWQGASAFVYYTKESLRLPGHSSRHPPVALYPGFRYRVMPIEGQGLGIAVDVMHLYADTRSLADRVAAGDRWRALVGRYFVYELGTRWYQIQFQEHTFQSISEVRFPDPKNPNQNIDVYAYTKREANHTNRVRYLRRDDPALMYTYPHQPAESYGAMSLARLRYQTDDLEVGSVHHLTVMPPEQRLIELQHVVQTYLHDKATLDGTAIRVDNRPLRIPAKVFSIPAQQFGHDKVLASPTKDKDTIRTMWRTREQWLQDKEIGFLNLAGIRNHFLLVPLSVADNEALMERIQKDVVSAVNQISPVPYHPTLVVWNDQGIRSIPEYKHALAEAQQHMLRAGVSCAIVILPSGIQQRERAKLRQHIKKMLHPSIRTKCVQAEAFMQYLVYTDQEYQIAPHQARRYQRYLFNTALDTLVTSGYWPWALAEPLKYDLYVGIDVLNNTAGFTFVGAQAAICRFYPVTSEQKEKLHPDQVSQILVEHLTQLIPRIRDKTGALPRHLVIHRDGRWYDTEQHGLDTAVARLCSQGLLPPDVHVGVVEVHKTSAERFRLFHQLHGRVTNPWVGSYHILSNYTGLVCTTGFPGLPQGTAEPLFAKIVHGKLDIHDVLRDIYWLSILAWTKPDGIQSEPLTIKLADDWLEAVGTKLSEFDDFVDRGEPIERAPQPVLTTASTR